MRFAPSIVVLLAASVASAQPVEPPPEPAPSAPPEPTPEPAPAPESPPAPAAASIASTPPSPGPAQVATEKPQHPGFRFGSYGRAITGTDLRGGKPEKITIVGRTARIVEASYLELDLSYGFMTTRGELRPVITLAFAGGQLFHDTGDFDAQPAIRNMFLEGAIAKDVYAWAGSRMYRGDDIYLYDYWPLDDQNTLGGGVMYRGTPVEAAVHAGFNRLNNPFTYQLVDVANPVQGATTVEQLNRQRIVASATVAYTAKHITDALSAKAKLHGELHSLPSGTRRREDGTLESLPSDRGLLVGAQLGVFDHTGGPFRRHLNVFARYASGLASFDELAPPTSFGPDLTTDRASELSFGVSANFDHAFGQLMLGGYSRRFIDADANPTDPDDGWSYSVDARPLVRVIPDFFVGADVSYTARFPKGLNPITLRAEDPALFQIAPMLVFSPMGPSAYDRPQLRLVYRAAHLNDAALNLYVPDDPRHAQPWVHYLGVQAEWWFNSSTYR